MACSAAAIFCTASRCGLLLKPSSATLAMYMVGLAVSRFSCFSSSRSSSPETTSVRAGRASFRRGIRRSSRSRCFTASLSPPRATRETRSSWRSALSRSASASSVLITSMSFSGSMRLATCTTLSSRKQRTTCAMASVSRMLARNWLPRPSPFEAPATSPAISTNSIVVGTMRCGFTMAEMRSCRGSGTGTMPVLGSMVQNGKFCAAMPARVSALKSVDLPTLGSPTMPQLNPMCHSTLKLFSLFMAIGQLPFTASGNARSASSMQRSMRSRSSGAGRESTCGLTRSRLPGCPMPIRSR